VSLWDVRVGNPYQPVVDALSPWSSRLRSTTSSCQHERTAGTDGNLSNLNQRKFWLGALLHHASNNCVVRGDASVHNCRTSAVTRCASPWSQGDHTGIDRTILELISQNSLYAGRSNTFELTSFRKLKVEFAKVRSVEAQDLFAWLHAKAVPAAVTRIRGNVIGSLLTDLSEGGNGCRRSFVRAKVAPTNYKRPTALITKGMIEKARTTIEELVHLCSGSALRHHRRHHHQTTFSSRTARQEGHECLRRSGQRSSEKVPNLDKIETVSSRLPCNVLPKAESLEVMFETVTPATCSA